MDEVTGVDEAVGIITRYPVPGKTKTRLIPHLGKEGAARLQRCMTEDVVGRFRTLDADLYIFFDGGNQRLMSEWLGSDLNYVAQQGNDLGERMFNALECLFSRGYTKALLIGSDIPDIPVHVIKQAFEQLETKSCVIGPARDGGYYLIGFFADSLESEVFSGIEWGTDSVYNATMFRLNQVGIACSLLSEADDLDQSGDLEKLLSRSEGTGFEDSKTISFLRENGF